MMFIIKAFFLFSKRSPLRKISLREIGHFIFVTLLMTSSQQSLAVTVDVSNALLAPDANIKFPLVQNNEASSYNRSLQDYKGKVVLVDFWASWCVPCRQSFPWMNKMQTKYQVGLSIVAINVDIDPHSAFQFLKQFPAKFDVLLDSDAKLQESFNVMGMPTSFLLDTEGRIRMQHVGFRVGDTDKYESDIQQLLNEKIKSKTK